MHSDLKIWKGTSTLDGLINDLTFADHPEEADVLLIGGKAINLNDFPKLRGIFKTGIGTDNLPFDEAATKGIAIGLPSEKTAEIIYEETAAFAAYLCLRMLYSEIGDLEKWIKQPRTALSRRQVLVIGNGNIGSRVVRKLLPLVEVTAFDIATSAPDELEPLFRTADCVTLHVPLNNDTRGFIDAEKLGWLKDGAALVNTARGPVVDENALLQELQTARIRAAFDVFWEEPYHGKLRQFHPDPFFITPHVASTCQEFLSATAIDFRRFLENEVSV